MKKLFSSDLKVKGVGVLHADSGYAYKDKAQERAQRLRNNNHYARVVDRKDSGGGWVVYAKRKQK
jgi:hypothetical protein